MDNLHVEPEIPSRPATPLSALGSARDGNQTPNANLDDQNHHEQDDGDITDYEGGNNHDNDDGDGENHNNDNEGGDNQNNDNEGGGNNIRRDNLANEVRNGRNHEFNPLRRDSHSTSSTTKTRCIILLLCIV